MLPATATAIAAAPPAPDLRNLDCLRSMLEDGTRGGLLAPCNGGTLPGALGHATLATDASSVSSTDAVGGGVAMAVSSFPCCCRKPVLAVLLCLLLATIPP